jgi:hypothetical protein
MLLMEYEQLDNLLEVVFKIKADENSKFGGKSLETEKESIPFYYEGKIKQEENCYRGFSKRKNNWMLDDILTIVPKRKLQTFRKF